MRLFVASAVRIERPVARRLSLRPSCDLTARGFDPRARCARPAPRGRRPCRADRRTCGRALRDRDVERNDGAGPREARPADRLRRVRRAPSALGAGRSSAPRRRRAERPAYALLHGLARLVGHEPPTVTPPTVTPKAIGAGVAGGSGRPAARWAAARSSVGGSVVVIRRRSAPRRSRTARKQLQIPAERRPREALRPACERRLSRRKCRQRFRREYARIVGHDGVDSRLVDARELHRIVDRPRDDRRRRAREAQPNARPRSQASDGHESGGAREREQRANEDGATRAQQAQADPREGAPALSEMRKTRRGTVKPVRTSPSSARSRARSRGSTSSRSFAPRGRVAEPPRHVLLLAA